MTKRWAISKTKNILVPTNTDTKNSIYPVLAYKASRKFTTRNAARLYKQLNPDNRLSIVDTYNNVVVR